MAFTASDVDNQSFTVDRKGYSIEEVDVFLEKVSKEVDGFNKKIKEGMIVSIYLMWYGIVRFFIESMRTDALMLGTLKMAQLISITLFIIGLVLFIFSIKHDKYNKEMK